MSNNPVLPSLSVFTVEGKEVAVDDTHNKIKKTKFNTHEDPGKLKVPTGKKSPTSASAPKILDQLTSAEFEVLRSVFDMFDKDQDGLVSTKDLGSLMRMLGQNPTEKDVTAILKKATTTTKDHMNFEEFVSLILKNGKSQKDMEDSLLEAFRLFDRNGDGWIDKDELKSMLKNIGEEMTNEELDRLFNEFDTNKDGKIDYAEFSKAMTADSLLPSLK